MSQPQNIALAQQFLEGLGGGQAPEEIAALFSLELVFEIQGDDGVLPWIGRKTGRSAIVDFVRDIRNMTEPLDFNVEDVLASESRAAVVGALRTRIKATGAVTSTQFAIILTVAGGVVTRFQMLEGRHPFPDAGRQLRRIEGGEALRRAWIIKHGNLLAF